METQEIQEHRKPSRSGENSNVVFVGQKPAMAYTLAVMKQIADGHKVVCVKARGRAISKAVDVAEIVRNKFVKGMKIKNIVIGTEVMEGDNKEPMNVSSIEIVLEN